MMDISFAIVECASKYLLYLRTNDGDYETVQETSENQLYEQTPGACTSYR